MRIRPARRSDVRDLARLWREFGTYYAELDPERFKVPKLEGLEQWVAERLDRPSEQCLVAEIEGNIAGYAVGSVVEPHPQADSKMLIDAEMRRLGIHVVHVSEPYRRQGVATELVRELEAWGREHGATIALAETDAHSPVAIPFWDRTAGYERTSTRFRKRL